MSNSQSEHNGIKVVHDRVLLKMDEPAQMTAAGILLIKNREEKPPHHGEVLAVGPGYQQDDGGYTPLDVKPGDRVVIEPYQGQHLTINGEEVTLVKAQYILAIEEVIHAEEEKAAA